MLFKLDMSCKLKKIINYLTIKKLKNNFRTQKIL